LEKTIIHRLDGTLMTLERPRILSGAVDGVRLATGERLGAEAVVVNADAGAVGAGLFGPAVARAVAPVPRVIGAGGAALHVAGRTEAEVIVTLSAGETFNLLDISGGWGWGQQGEDGFVGYLPMTALA
jgi:hypothetical protein